MHAGGQVSSSRILVVEDEITLGKSIHTSLGREGMTVDVVRSLQSADTKMAAGGYDLILLDIGLPDGNGREWLKKHIRSASFPPVIFITSDGEALDRILGLELGADDYIPKPFDLRELCARVKAVLRRAGRILEPLSLGGASPFRVDDTTKRIFLHDIDLCLTRHEYLLLQVLLQRPAHVLSRAQLLHAAWEDPGSVLDRTIDAHVRRIRAKIRPIDQQDWIVTHAGFGYSIRINHEA